MKRLEGYIANTYYRRDIRERRLRSAEYLLRFHTKRPAVLASEGITPALLAELRESHAQATQELKELAELHPLWTNWLIDVKGIGPVMAGSIIATWGDIEKTENVSQVWSSATLGVVDGQAQRRLSRGRKAVGFGPFVRVSWLCRDQLLKARGVYFTWKNEREIWELANGAKDDKHARRRAMRVMSKLFLYHCYAVWREARGLPVQKPYAFSHLLHGGKLIEPLRDVGVPAEPAVA